MTRSVTILAVAVVLVLAACGAENSEETTTRAPESAVEADESVTTTEGEQAMQDSGTPTPPVRTDRSYASDEYPDELGGIVAIAIADLAARQEIDESEIGVVLVEEVVWPDSAMGCPEPGMAYAQATQDGLRIVLAYDGSEYAYHSGGMLDPFLCAPGPGLVKEPTVPQIDITDPATYPGGATTESTIAADAESDVKTDETVPTEQVGGPGDPDE